GPSLKGPAIVAAGPFLRSETSPSTMSAAVPRAAVISQSCPQQPAAGAGNIETPGAVDTYTFTGTAGQKVFVNYVSAGNCGLNWRLIGPANATVFGSRGICSDPGQFTLATAGTYTLTVDTAATSSATGTYSFGITDVPVAQSFGYTVGNTVSNGVPAAGAGNIETPGAVDTYTFTGTAGQKVFVDYITPSACGLNWRLTGPANATVFASRGICSDPGQFTLATAGTYTITVDTSTTSSATGTYSFRITNVPGPQSFTYAVGNTVSNGVPAAGAGNIETPGAVDIYTFTAPAGQKVFVDYLTASSCYLNWRLMGPANAPVFASRGICSDPGQLTLATAGTYILTVDTPTTSADTATYSFRITNVPGPQSFTYAVGNTVSNGVPAAGAGNIETPGAVDTYAFTGTAGQKVFVDYISATTCSFYWRLIGPANATVFASRGICADPGQLTLPAAGTYTLTVDTPPTSSTTGTYSFRITNVPGPQAFGYTLGAQVSDGVPAAGAGNIETPGAVDTYTFTGAAGQKIFVDYISPSACGLNWRLMGPANATVFGSRGICSDPGQFTLPTAGTYTLTVDTPATSANTGTYSFRITDVA
ncbi:MAG: hypothetical protein ACR2KK_03700, partial [Acidimicrobiales bacterium]